MDNIVKKFFSGGNGDNIFGAYQGPSEIAFRGNSNSQNTSSNNFNPNPIPGMSQDVIILF